MSYDPLPTGFFGDLDLDALKKKKVVGVSEPAEAPALFGDIDTKYLSSSYLYGPKDSQVDFEIQQAAMPLRPDARDEEVTSIMGGRGAAARQAFREQVRQAPDNLSPESVTQFEESPEVIERFDRLTDYLSNNDTFMSALVDPGSWGSNDDVVEFLRDDVVRIGSKLNKAMLLEDAPDQIKEDYRYLQERFDKAELSGIGEYMGAFMDYGADVVFNPETLVGVLGTIFSGGTGAGGVAAAQTGARMALSKALGKAAAATSLNSAKSAAAYAGVFTGLDDFAAQTLDMSLEKREEYDPLQTATAGTIGAATGAVLFKGGQAVASRINRKRVEDEFFTDFTIEDGPDFNERAREAFEAARRQDEARAAAMPGTEVGFPQSAPELLENLTPRLESPLEADDLVDDEGIKRLVADIGGGSQTEQEIIDAAIAASRKETPEAKQNSFMNRIYRLTAGATSSMFGGKAAGILSPYTKGSATARILQNKLSREFAKVWRGPQGRIKEDLAEAQRTITGNLYEEYLSIVEPIALNKINGKLKDNVNNALNLVIRGDISDNKQINNAGLRIRNLYRNLGDKLNAAGIIDHKVENYTPRMWNRKAIENDTVTFRRLLIEEGEARTIEDADRIVAEMLDKKNQLDSGTAGHFFSAKRRFENIKNDSKFNKFLSEDVESTLYNYIYQAGRSLAKKRVLNVRNESEFIEQWINPIIRETETNQGRTLSKAERKKILDLYRYSTGENIDRYGDTVQNIADGYSFANRVALLPLATISSISEVLINVSKAGVVNSVKGLGEALETSFAGKLGKGTHELLMNKHGLTAKEAWREMYEYSLAMEQGLSQVGNRLAGDDLLNETMQKASNKFFRLNFLDQWTKFAQITSFATGKRLVENNIRDIAEHGTAKVTKRIQNKMDELAELGIDVDAARNWYGGGARVDSDFYGEIKKAAARYTNDIVLQPTAMSGLKPRLYTNPKTSILFQLLGYPAAFTNTILKGAAKQLVRNPTQNSAKIVTAGLMMTELQRGLNYIRSQGESENLKTPAEARLEAIKRWGGNGLLFDQIERASNAVKYSGNISMYATLPFGPLPGDIANLYNKPVTTLGTKVPGYAAGNMLFGQETMREYRRSLGELDRAAKDKLVPSFDYDPRRSEFAKGGIVNVPQAPEEPDERIDKMTGLPYNVQAGGAFIDEEDPEKLF